MDPLKKLIITIFISLLANNFIYSQSLQIDSMKTTMSKAGKELHTFYFVHSTGVVLELVGLGVGVAGLIPLPQNNNIQGLSVLGGIVFVAGCITDLASFKHIKNAGIILERNGIAIPIRQRKPSKKYLLFSN